jgi:glycosyl transferase, family 25
MQIYFINLDRRQDRLAHMTDQLQALGLSGQRVPALTPANLDPAMIARHCDRTRVHAVTPTELAISMSHRRAWSLMLEAGHQRALFLEDDAVLAKQLPAVLHAAQTAKFDMLKLDTSREVIVHRPTGQVLCPGFGLHQLYYYHFGCGGYVLDAAFARRILADERWLSWPIDDALQRPFGPLFGSFKLAQCVPTPVIALDRLTLNPGGVAASDAQHDIKALGLPQDGIHRLQRYLALRWRYMRESAFADWGSIVGRAVRSAIAFADD